MKIVIDIPL